RDRWERRRRIGPQSGSAWTRSAWTTRSSSSRPVARRRVDRMILGIRSSVLVHSCPQLNWIWVLIFGIGLSLVSADPALLAEPAVSPPLSAASGTPRDAPSALEEAHAAKRAAASYRDADALPQAAASWTHAAQAYERAGDFGDAALAWTEAAALHEQQQD